MVSPPSAPPVAELLSVEDFQSLIAALPARSLAERQIGLDAALGARLARPVFNERDVPPCTNSAMDGYAVNAAELVAQGYRLPVSMRIAAGHAPSRLPPNTAARIFTGAPIPEGADAVILQEDVTLEAGQIHYPAQTPLRPQQHLRPQGQDMAAGQLLAPAGSKITPALLGLLAAQGLHQLAVQAPLRVALVSTGNELIEPGEPLPPGCLYNSNRYSLMALLHAWGQVQLDCRWVPDSLSATQQLLHALTTSADVILCTGGVSAGEEDHLKNALLQLGQLTHWKVRLKPGKPILLGNLPGKQGPVAILGLPGNPVSAWVCFLLFGQPLLNALCGTPDKGHKPYLLPAGFELTRPQSRAEFARAIYQDGLIHRLAEQSSGVLSSLHQATGLVRLPENRCVARGELLPFYSLNDLLYGSTPVATPAVGK